MPSFFIPVLQEKQAYHIFLMENWDASEQQALSDKCGSYLTWST